MINRIDVEYFQNIECRRLLRAKQHSVLREVADAAGRAQGPYGIDKTKKARESLKMLKQQHFLDLIKHLLTSIYRIWRDLVLVYPILPDLVSIYGIWRDLVSIYRIAPYRLIWDIAQTENQSSFRGTVLAVRKCSQK